ncbi:MFS transporter, FHS family, L-fucose permease [Hymenobacter daecheongensis DSM 21074]|uniref:MFS transporter, FHS family, L-fucose permease n=1 Tax=Hymenobacter daecheongensis DSM 21074 TaxID=1121955 RepID=A0A1M6G6W6_9BACT|nr:sugar MFS transporter [Hymenobacter daecheongensis]SHJ05695.1 MFS transporter, FHS family, L-fucose permease [Hymenobacter daecheongensis DSM 21074]
MALITSQPRSGSAPAPAEAPGASPSYTSALASLTVLFFMMGFITCLNDILIPYLKGLFTLSYAKVNLVNFCFFGAYFVMGVPAGQVVKRLGYKKGMLLGFLIAAVGCFLFYPAAESRTFELFLGALFVLATGIVTLQVAGNPYVSILGPPETASSRLTLTQAFNSLATFIAPILGSWLILSHLPDLKTLTPAQTANLDVTAVQNLYLGIGVVLVLISLVLSFLKLPHIAHEPAPAGDTTKAWHYRHLLLGLVGIFCYVGAEVAIGSHIVSYLGQSEVMNMAARDAGVQVAFYWGGAMVGRFLGIGVLRNFKPGRVLAFNALVSILLVLISVNTTGVVAMWSLLAVGLMNSIMFPVIFTLAVAGLGRHTEDASGLLSAAIVGGAIIPPLFGLIADSQSGGGGVHALRLAFVLPMLCYAYIVWYGLRGSRRQA